MKFNLEEVSSFSEEQLETLMNEIEKNPLIIVPHYLLKSKILDYLPIEIKRNETLNKLFDESSSLDYLNIKNIIQSNLYQRVEDSIEHNLIEWIDYDFEDDEV